MARRYKRRRGIVILVVLSLLVLFVVLVVTFAIVAGQFRNAAFAYSKQELVGVDPPKDLEKGFHFLLRGGSHLGSAILYHELLRDMYGEDGFTGTLVGRAQLTVFNSDTNNYPAAAMRSGGRLDTSGAQPFAEGGQCLALVIDSIAGSTDGQSYTFNPIPGTYNGCVLTITSGRAKGLSTRIISSYVWYNTQNATDPFNNRAVLRVMTPAKEDGTTVNSVDVAGASFVVNGRPFSGTGFGYNTTVTSGPRLTRTVPFVDSNAVTHNLAVALLPNHSVRSGVASVLLQGGSDEGYDVADYQNLPMAAMQSRPDGTVDVMPSFHRPALVRFWRTQYSNLWQYDLTGAFKRQFILRPIEPNFDGSNPDYYPPVIDWSQTPPAIDPTVPSWYETAYTTKHWDVDNDGDGVRDSIWLDLGLPVQMTADGRRYKPLFAILCLDMDGRLNVNAHGRIAIYQPGSPAMYVDSANPNQPVIYRKGLGYGPPEVDLTWTGITGNLSGLLMSRYGSDGRPGQANAFERLARIRFFEEPKNYFRTGGVRSSYSSPSDLRAELAFGVNVAGQPQFETTPDLDIETRMDSPYESNLVDRSATDAPYTAAEGERLWRRYDHDRHLLPGRLANNINSGSASLVTTHSFDVPMPSITAPSELVNYINATLNDSDTTNDLSAHNVIDLLVARLQATRDAQSLARFNVATLGRLLGKMLSPDLAMGLRFDLNRPIGNAQDDSTYTGTGDRALQGVGIVDEPALRATNTELQNERLHNGINAVGRAEFNNVGMWHNNGFVEPDMDNGGLGNGFVDDLDGDGEGNGVAPTPVDSDDNALSRLLVRQRYVRHLYVLMLTLMDHGTTGGIPNPPNANEAQKAAQWAVNVVDFRDADSIMTPFEYDPNPFDGWSVDGFVNGYHGMVSGDDGLPAAQRGLVWGCERPELLLTEAMAFHARRTRDAATDTTGSNHDLASGNDLNYDQDHLAFASAFVEMYNPWAGADTNMTPPQELYGFAGGVQLNRTTPSGDPVWRLLFINARDNALNPGSINDNSIDPDVSAGAVNADRAIYFINTAPANLPAGAAHGQRQYYTDQRVNPIPPGQYAVVGGGYQSGVQWVSPVGHIDPATTGTDSQRIVLSPTTNQVSVHPGTIDPASGQPVVPEVASAVAIVANLSTVNPNTRVQTAFNVSEPQIGYPIDAGGVSYDVSSRLATPGARPVPFRWNGRYEDPATGNALPHDVPMDLHVENNNPGLGFPQTVVQTDGTTRTFCRVYLQRLANPLHDYNPQANPFRTVDSTTMDLTVFNGMSGFPQPTIPNTPGVDLSCLQRGDSDPATSRLRLWPQEPPRTAVPGQAIDANSVMFFNYVLQHSLGKRNDNHPVLPNGSFPWFVWNNRPFVSGYELMHVPRFKCWDLLKTYNVTPVSNFGLPSDYTAPFNPYDGQTPPYRHLMDFLHADSSSITAPHYYRIFDYVGVPSRFVGTDTVLNPTFFGGSAPQPNLVSLGFLPPFNRISKYRVPGLGNINTIPSGTVWGAFRGPHIRLTLDPTDPTQVLSRQAAYFDDSASPRPIFHGDGATTNGVFDSREGTLGDNIPTVFRNPFRPAGAGDMVPLTQLQSTTGIEQTLLRAHDDYPNTPLMQLTNTTDPVRHTRNSFFRYEMLHRAGNMVTTRSNVYTIWITVGYFEMEPNYNAAGVVVYDDLHPEGLRVAQEIGIETGEIQRHRAFYMIDRTIPVAFEPGENHNVDKCVLVRRFIE